MGAPGKLLLYFVEADPGFVKSSQRFVCKLLGGCRELFAPGSFTQRLLGEGLSP